MTQIRLQDAYLCADCNCVTDSAIQCPCGSQHGLLSIATVLDRPEKMAPRSEQVKRLLDVQQQAAVLL